MSQNRSTAVMQRRAEAGDSLDYFPTPPWATRALCEELKSRFFWTFSDSAWEPACGAGDMARPMGEYFPRVYASDVADLGYGEVRDFLFPGPRVDADWIITNPPFRLAEQFALTAIDLAREGVALFVRTAFLEGIGRHERLFSRFPPSDVYQFTERVPIHKGRLVENGSTATAYCWVVWRRERRTCGTAFRWIAPCRRALERSGDYPEVAA